MSREMTNESPNNMMVRKGKLSCPYYRVKDENQNYGGGNHNNNREKEAKREVLK